MTTTRTGPTAGEHALAAYVSNLACRTAHEEWSMVAGTLCFADVSGFTKLSERLARSGRVGAEELTAILSVEGAPNPQAIAELRRRYDTEQIETLVAN